MSYPPRGHRTFLPSYLQEPSHIMHTCHVGFHVDFSFTENVVGCNSKLPSCNPKARAHDTLNQLESKDSQEAKPKGICVNGPSCSCT